MLDVANTSFNVPLNEGADELLIGIAVKDYGWGIAARVESLRNILLRIE